MSAGKFTIATQFNASANLRQKQRSSLLKSNPSVTHRWLDFFFLLKQNRVKKKNLIPTQREVI
jgi:hypothetical protein